MAFTTRAIEIETLGRILQKARAAHGWELRDVERIIGISVKYLEFLETDNFYKLPSPTYTRGFLERYAHFLQLNPEEIIKRWKKESEEVLSSGVKFPKRAKRLPLNVFRKNRFLFTQRHFFKRSGAGFNFNAKTFIFGFIILIVLTYLGFGVKKILFPPRIEIFFPPDNWVTEEASLIIEGKTESGVNVFINQEPVKNISAGYFQESLELLPGLNIIKISAKKKYSRERIIQRRVVVQE